tara:strand:- start:2974 stop:3732 length:759 start_codon:yes stop_codon:yes gene_type:complete
MIPKAKYNVGDRVIAIAEDGESFPATIRRAWWDMILKRMDYEVQEENGAKSDGYTDEMLSKAKEEELETGETSDGYHTFNELYEHRHALFLALMASNPDISWYSMKHHDGSEWDGCFIAGMMLPTGDVTYHLPISMTESARLTGAKFRVFGREWDGHTAGDVVKRLRKWAKFVPEPEKEGCPRDTDGDGNCGQPASIEDVCAEIYHHQNWHNLGRKQQELVSMLEKSGNLRPARQGFVGGLISKKKPKVSNQ